MVKVTLDKDGRGTVQLRREPGQIVQFRRTAYGLQEHPGQYSTQERARMCFDVCAAYRDGWSIRAAAALAGCSYSMARLLLAEGGVKPRPRGPRSTQPTDEMIDATPEQRAAFRLKLSTQPATPGEPLTRVRVTRGDEVND